MKSKILISVGLLWFSMMVGLAGELPSEWMPEWQAGDWWVLSKQVEAFRVIGRRYSLLGRPEKIRFEITGIEQVNGRDCFVVEMKIMPTEGGRLWWWVFYFQRDDFKLVKEVYYSYSHGKLERSPFIGYEYTQSVAIAGQGRPVNVPAFPLACKVARADSLFGGRRNPSYSFITQSVSRGKLRISMSGLCLKWIVL